MTEQAKTREETQAESLQSIGKNALASLREMVAALECDYERLEELREAFADWRDLTIENSDPENGGDGRIDPETLTVADWAVLYEDGEELAELEAAATCCGEKCESREDAERFIQEDPLSIQYRGGWYAPGDEDKGGDAEEFEVLLCTGGPAVRIIGTFGQGKSINDCRLQVQDWGTPWTDYYEEGISDVLEAYCVALGVDCD